MHTRRPILKRVAVWTAVVVLALASYITGAPAVVYLARIKLPSALPVVSTIYAPLGYWYDDTTIPGSLYFRAYCDGCEEQISRWLK